MDIQIIRQVITRQALQKMATQQFGDMLKAVVDVEQGIMAIGGELHSDEEAALLDQGSQQKHYGESTSTLVSRTQHGSNMIR